MKRKISDNPAPKEKTFSFHNPSTPPYINKSKVIKMPDAAVCWSGPCEQKITIPSPDSEKEVMCAAGCKPKNGKCSRHITWNEILKNPNRITELFTNVGG